MRHLLVNSSKSWVTAPTIVSSTQLLWIPELLFHAQTQLLSSPDPVSHYKISLTSCFLQSLHSCVFHSCTHCLAVFPLEILISPTNALFPDSVYKTLIHVCIQYVWILTLTIVLIDYSASSSLWTSELQFPYFQKYSSFNLIYTLSSFRLCSVPDYVPNFQPLTIEILGHVIVGRHSTQAEANVQSPSELLNFWSLIIEIGHVIVGRCSAWAEANIWKPSDLPNFQLSSAVH